MLRRGGLPCHPQPAVPHGIVDGSAARQGYRGPRKMKPNPRALVPCAIAPRRPAALLGAMVGLVLATAAVRGRGFALGSRAIIPGRGSLPAAPTGRRVLPRSRSPSIRVSRPTGARRANPGCRRRSTGRGRKTFRRSRCSGRRRSRFEDAGGVAYGYKDRVLLPVRVEPEATPESRCDSPLKLDYGVCKDICIPAQASLALALRPGEAPPPSAAIEEALARVPRPQALGAPGDLSILASSRRPSSGKPALAIAVRAPPDADAVRRGARGLVSRRRAAAARSAAAQRRRRRPVPGRDPRAAARRRRAARAAAHARRRASAPSRRAASLDTARLPR